MSTLQASGDWRQALTIFLDLGRFSLRISRLACTGLIASCARFLGWQLALQAQQRLQEAAVEADVVLALSALEAVEESNRWRLTSALFTHLAKEVRGNEFLFSSLLSAHGK
ncbi:unnamed protein product, partial [Symbiodinium sp. CCMP2456]